MPSDMLAQYMVAMGTDRQTALELASAFAAEQRQAGNAPLAAAANKRNSVGAQSSWQQKLQEAERPSRSSSMPTHPPRRTGSIHSTDFVHAPPQRFTASISAPNNTNRRASDGSPSYPPPYEGVPQADDGPKWESTPTIAVDATIVEARPIKEDDLEQGIGAPIVYAESTPISLKHLIRERPVRRLMVLAACLMIAGVIAGVAFYVVQGNKVEEIPVAETTSPSTTPSMAPTFVLPETYQAALKLSGDDALEDPNSPQLRAVGWLSSVDTVDTGGYGRRFEQRYALATMFYSLRGEEWTHSDQWLDPTMHECDWGGIFCGVDATDSRVVTGLDSTRNNLQGTLPAEIGLLTSTELLRMPRNRISGSIPPEIGNLASLSSIDLDSNDLTGPIPSTIGDMKNVVVINLSHNHLNGSMPDSLYSLKFLRTLLLRENSISGVMTQGVNNLTLLATLDVRYNQFTGHFPITFESLPSLDIARFDHNQFSGPLPTLTGDLVTRQTLSLSHNQFEGNVKVDPATYGTSTTGGEFRLQFCDVSYNKLAGPISAVIGFLPTMRHMDFSGNQFTGTFPNYLGWPAIEFLIFGAVAAATRGHARDRSCTWGTRGVVSTGAEYKV